MRVIQDIYLNYKISLVGFNGITRFLNDQSYFRGTYLFVFLKFIGRLINLDYPRI